MATCAELGFPGFDIATMIGLQLPAGAPAEIVTRLQAEVAKALREPDMAERFTTLGMELQESGTAHYVRFLREDIDRYSAAVKDGGIRAN